MLSSSLESNGGRLQIDAQDIQSSPELHKVFYSNFKGFQAGANTYMSPDWKCSGTTDRDSYTSYIRSQNKLRVLELKVSDR